MKTPLHEGETIVVEARANLQRGIETVGGRLYLTNRRLIFESHRFNIQAGATCIPLAEVAGARKCWTKFLYLLPVFPNSMAVSTVGGKEFRLVVDRRQEWIDEIERRRG